MAAGVSYTGQRVIFGEDCDGGTAVFSELCGIGCLEPERAALNRNVVARDRILQLRRRFEFLQCEFRLLVNRMRKVE